MRSLEMILLAGCGCSLCTAWHLTATLGHCSVIRRNQIKTAIFVRLFVCFCLFVWMNGYIPFIEKWFPFDGWVWWSCSLSLSPMKCGNANTAVSTLKDDVHVLSAGPFVSSLCLSCSAPMAADGVWGGGARRERRVLWETPVCLHEDAGLVGMVCFSFNFCYFLFLCLFFTPSWRVALQTVAWVWARVEGLPGGLLYSIMPAR